jgi:hypothetical protein
MPRNWQTSEAGISCRLIIATSLRELPPIGCTVTFGKTRRMSIQLLTRSYGLA